MKQSPIRKLRRDRSRLMQDLALANAGGGGVSSTGEKAADIEARIKALDKEIAAMEAARGDA